MNQCQMTDKEQITDLLTTQKHLTSTYNTYCNETATPELRQCLLTILRDEHSIAEEIFNTMSTRGWYTVEKAEDTKVKTAKDQFAQYATI